MKRIFLLALMVIGLSISGVSQEIANFVRTAGEAVVSPEIKDGSVTFRFKAPKARAVKMFGSWMDYGTTLDLVEGKNGVWEVTVKDLPSEIYTYNFFVDGVSVNDPNNYIVQRDGTRYLNVLLVPGEVTDNYKEASKRGNLSKVWYDSPTIGTNRRMYVYTPYGYEKSKEKYPVLYLLHGGGGDEDAWSNMGRACEILDNLIEKGLAKPMICVMPNGNPTQEAARILSIPEKSIDLRDPSNANLYIHSIVKDIVPYIEKNYKVIKKPSARAISGLSMGGGHTLACTNEYPGFFSYICPMSMGIRGDQADIDAKFQAVKAAGYKLYWVGCGDKDFVFQMANDLHAALERNGLEHTYYVSGGGHTWQNWRSYLTIIAQKLFK